MNNIAIFASGSGTNAENLITHFRNNKIISKVLIFTENPNAFVLKRAAKLNVESIVFTKEELINGKVLSILEKNKIHFIILAGFLKLIPGEITTVYKNRIVNIHPALLPNYGGKGMYGDKVHSAVIQSGEKESGVTIHFVNSKYDEGDIILQVKCPVFYDDTPETLAKRVHELEYRYYPEVVMKLLKNLQATR